MSITDKGFGIGTTAVASLLLALSALTADAQDVAHNFDELRLKVAAGDTVYVTESTGKERQARIVEISGSSLAVSIDGTHRNLTEPGVTRIRRRLSDSLWNGAAIGAAASVGVGLAVGASFDALDDCDAACWAINGLYYGGMGALVGTGIDAMFKGRKTIYMADRQSSTTISLRPLLSSGSRSVIVAVRF